MEAKVSGNNVVIKISTDQLEDIFNGHPELWHEEMRVKFKRKFAESFASYLDDHLKDDPNLVFEEMFNTIFECMMEDDDPSIAMPLEK
ncbi:hypothetical protein LD13_gp127 [Bacillus phage Bobb]|uniref:Uncharacterized protein n=1 Tax=Bacillus phage Bobb TaxID=1527469 RepID=A0A076G8V5_9CAUD|nr:hypothetical protein LD13_gp127 [Bacillus phage Bobb]AII28028.1 hypothetical protein [Bacillus phage Bobb]